MSGGKVLVYERGRSTLNLSPPVVFSKKHAGKGSDDEEAGRRL